MAEAGRTRRGAGWWLVRLVMLVAASSFAFVRPAAAQSVLRDAETEALLNDLARPLVQAAGLQPGNVRIVLLYDRDINAFVAGGQIVYLHSGLITSADNANEVQGVIAHELGHITGGHIIRMQEGVQQATGIMILSLLLGAAAIAAGAGEAGMAALAAGQQAAMGTLPVVQPGAGEQRRPGRRDLSAPAPGSAAAAASPSSAGWPISSSG